MFTTRRLQLIISSLAVFTACVIVINSCRRIQHEDLPGQSVAAKPKFFDVPENADPIIKALADKIYRQNEKYHFVNDLVKRVGYPVWGKSLIVTNQGARGANARVMDDSTTLVYVPFTIDSIQVVKATLLAQMSPDDSLFRFIYDREYWRFGFDSSANNYAWKAKNIFHLFSRFQRSIYNHRSFQITDGRLLGKDSSVKSVLSFQEGTGWQRTSVLQPVQVCDVFIDCGECRAFKTSTSYGPESTPCCYPTVVNHCTTQWINVDPGAGTLPPLFYTTNIGGGGITDPSIWWVNPSYPCPGGGGGVPRMSVTEECSAVGWIPMPTTGGVLYPNMGYHHLETWDISGEDYANIQFWRQNNIDSSNLDSCRRLLLNKLLNNLNGNLLGKILSKISLSIYEPGNMEKFKVKFKMKPLGGNIAQTDSFSYNTGNGIFSCNITLDSAIASNATDIYVAGSLLHETIHAYMKSLLFRLKNNISLSQLQAMSNDSVFTEYVDSLTVRNRANILQILSDPQNDHNYMASKLLEIIADALKKFDNNTINNDRYYWFLSWKGLYDTKPWIQHWPNYRSSPNLPIVGAPLTTDDSSRRLKYALTPLRLDSINNAIINERDANSNAKGRKPLVGGCY